MKESSGILMARKKAEWEFLLLHTGGPYWQGKDEHAWSFPKGELDPNEDMLEAAQREWHEESGFDIPPLPYIKLSVINNRHKRVQTYLVVGDVDLTKFTSNTYEQEWPPKSGKMASFPEADEACWFTAAVAKKKLHRYLVPVIDLALAKLN